MKKFLATLFIISLFLTPVFAKTDRASEEYLKTGRHLSVMNPFAEAIVEHSIKKAIKKEARGKYRVKFRGYTLSSMKKGIFKYLEIRGKHIVAENIHIPYCELKTVTDYNWIAYDEDPVVFKSDVTFNVVAHLSEETINDALQTEEYLKVIRKINKLAFPLFTLNKVTVKIKNNKVHLIMFYNIPLKPNQKERTFMVSSGFRAENGKIRTYGIGFDNAYGNLPLNKVTNLINLINPLEFTTNLLDNNSTKSVIESLKIEDDIVKINGKIYVKGENK